MDMSDGSITNNMMLWVMNPNFETPTTQLS